MRSICDGIVERLSDWWGLIGWGLFIGCFVIPYFAWQSPELPTIWVTLVLLTLLWWAIDAVSQSVALWQVLTGALMLGLGLLPFGRILIIACWAIYWTRVRE